MAEDQTEIDSDIDERINELVKGLEPSTTTKMPAIVVLFLEKDPFKAKKKTGWFGQTKHSQDLKAWELWTVETYCIFEGQRGFNQPLAMVDAPDMTASTRSFESALNKIIDYADANKHHIPPISSLDSCPFPCTIEVWPHGVPGSTPAQPANADDTWGNYIKKMLD